MFDFPISWSAGMFLSSWLGVLIVSKEIEERESVKDAVFN